MILEGWKMGTEAFASKEISHKDMLVSESLDKHESQHELLLNDSIRSALPSLPKDDARQNPEYKNGLASEKLMDIEKWLAEEKRCGAVDQDKFMEKLSKFAEETDKTWKSMSEKVDDQFLKMSEDQFMTYPRFTDMLFQLDEEHQNKIREVLPGSLTPGE
ncbi:MAG: hypothetical protein K2X27_03525 [Candidatus Obscuribacterales bacterium]|nr:hypothetical protein [Candidatus Obscuribacterales bacterium]